MSQAKPDHYVSFSAEIIPPTTEVLLATCANLANQEVETIHLLLSSPGGSVPHGISIYNTLRALPIRLITYNMGNVDSIGNVVYLAGERRYASPQATFMFHGVGLDVRDGMRLEEKFLRERLDSIEADHERIASIIEDRADFPDKEEIPRLFLQAATMNATDARKHGIAHDVRELEIPRGAPIHQLVFQR